MELLLIRDMGDSRYCTILTEFLKGLYEVFWIGKYFLRHRDSPPVIESMLIDMEMGAGKVRTDEWSESVIAGRYIRVIMRAPVEIKPDEVKHLQISVLKCAPVCVDFSLSVDVKRYVVFRIVDERNGE